MPIPHRSSGAFDAADNKSDTAYKGNAPAPERNLKQTNDLHPSWILEEGKDVRMCLESLPSTQAVTSLISYKPQKSNREEEIPSSIIRLERFWAKVQAELKGILPTASYETWISPCKLISAQPGIAIIAVESEFNRSQVAKRWLKQITECITAMAKKPVQVKLVVEPSLFQEGASTPTAQSSSQPNNPSLHRATNTQWPLATHQNPTNCPRVASLLERYGDMRQVILKCPMFREAITPEAKGGWGIGVGAMIKAGKEFGLARLLYALEHTKAKLGANSKGGTFYYYLRNDFDPKRC